ncbi:MAG: hypothetical protein CM15mP21_3530 [Hyphomicrobiales bacterium]|nr:MAG: hypothetical protein CM15mP21_3530 [Hyphomicrobiales bacterium]
MPCLPVWANYRKKYAARPMRGRVLAKIPKPQQDRRIDLPALGPQTIAGAARAGLAGIVFEADGVLLRHRTRASSKPIVPACFYMG